MAETPAISDRNLEAATNISLKREPACFAFLSARSVAPPMPIDSINLDLASADYFNGRASLWTTLEMRSSVNNDRATAILGFVADKFDITFPTEVSIPLMKDVKSPDERAKMERGPKADGRRRHVLHRAAEQCEKTLRIDSENVTAHYVLNQVRATVDRAAVIGEVVALARDLVNTAPGDLRPDAFAQAAVDACTPVGLDVQVLDEKALAEGGYGGIVGVGAGSSNPPRLVRIAYDGGKAAKIGMDSQQRTVRRAGK